MSKKRIRKWNKKKDEGEGEKKKILINKTKITIIIGSIYI